MSAGYRCLWSKVGVAVCGKPATHGTLLGESTYYLCATHAAAARREGWRGVRPLRKEPRT